MFKNLFKSRAERLIERTMADDLKYKGVKVIIDCKHKIKAFNEKGYCEDCGTKRIRSTLIVKYSPLTGKQYRICYYECPRHPSYYRSCPYY